MQLDAAVDGQESAEPTVPDRVEDSTQHENRDQSAVQIERHSTALGYDDEPVRMTIVVGADGEKYDVQQSKEGDKRDVGQVVSDVHGLQPDWDREPRLRFLVWPSLSLHPVCWSEIETSRCCDNFKTFH